jgi:hypothetical protein
MPGKRYHPYRKNSAKKRTRTRRRSVVGRKTKAKARTPQAKQLMKAKRQPFVEVKRRILHQIANQNANSDGVFDPNYIDPLEKEQLDHSMVDIWDFVEEKTLSVKSKQTHLNLEPFYRQTQGIHDSQMVGESIFSRRLVVKGTLEWPSGTAAIINPVRFYLVAGWIKAPLNLEYSANTPARPDQVDRQYVQAYIKSKITQDFNKQRSALKFENSRNESYKIECYKRLVPNKESTNVFGVVTRSSVPASTMTFEGSSDITSSGGPAQTQHFGPPNGNVVVKVPAQQGAVYGTPRCNFHHTFKTDRKVVYTKGKEIPVADSGEYSPPDPDTEGWFPNQSWLPFAFIYQPDIDECKNEVGSFSYPLYQYNVLHTYTDS